MSLPPMTSAESALWAQETGAEATPPGTSTLATATALTARTLILRTLATTSGNVRLAARLLGISRATLDRRIAADPILTRARASYPRSGRQPARKRPAPTPPATPCLACAPGGAGLAHACGLDLTPPTEIDRRGASR